MSNLGILKKIGFSSTGITETIITIECGNMLYSTPIGFKLCRDKLVAKVYKNTLLHELLSRKDCKLCLCITSSSMLFYRSVLERDYLKYIYLKDVDRKCIQNCDSYINLDLIDIIDRKQYSLHYFKPFKIIIANTYPKGFHRYDYAIVESLVYLTKMTYVDENTRLSYYERILWCRDIVYRTCSNRFIRVLINNIVEKASKYLEK
ncbi:MAG: DUF447 family protein [Desulfurococcaceae archaeon]